MSDNTADASAVPFLPDLNREKVVKRTVGTEFFARNFVEVPW